MSYKNETAIIIPSLNPDEKLIQLVENCRDVGFFNILIINDGSNPNTLNYFQKAADEYGCMVIHHAVNLGKGRALKTAFNYILTEWKHCTGAVTVDSDGQHSMNDTIRIAQTLYEHPESLVIGCRNFSKNSVPLRSRFGNKLTRRVLSTLCGLHITDTQTGLRGLSAGLMKLFVPVPGERYEYEMNMLLETKYKNISIIEVPIETIYIDNNQTSHFNPIVDSIKIYALFLKFIVSALSSFSIDIVLFTVFNAILRKPFPENYIILSTIIARVFSSLYNFTINKNSVFKVKEKQVSITIKYFLLSLLQMFISAFCVKYLFDILNINEALIKVFTDLLLFVISFQIQMRWVFRRKNEINQSLS